MNGLRAAIGWLFEVPQLNFLMTNWVPRRQLTLFMAWFSKLRQPWVRVPSIAIWKFFADVDLSDARKQHFDSLHDCFVRELRLGARPVDDSSATLVSPCDGIVGASGIVTDGTVLQAKGRSYTVAELLNDPRQAQDFEGCGYVTLRLTAGMYHRFHAPDDCSIERVTYIPGDTWNVNPAALARVDRLYCRNERAVISCRIDSTQRMVLVPVAAILVASIRLHCLDRVLHQRYRGPHVFDCNSHYRRGEELGWFEHGSTLLVFVPRAFRLAAGLQTDSRVRMGEALFAGQLPLI